MSTFNSISAAHEPTEDNRTRSDQIGQTKPTDTEPVEQDKAARRQDNGQPVKPQRFDQQDAQKGILTDADPDDPASP